MQRLPSERAKWLAQNVVPHERVIRAWLSPRAYELDIDDIVQEMYSRLASLETVEEIGNPRQYAMQTAVSILLNQARHARIVPMIAIGDFEELGLQSPDPSPERAMQARDDLREVEASLLELPAICREAFLLRRVGGLSQKEVAERLGISIKTVEKYMAKSVRMLIQAYGRGGRQGSEVSIALGATDDETEKTILHK